MATCKICLNQFKNLRFKTARVCVCERCTNDLNSYKEVAEDAYKAARDLLLKGMLRRASNEASSPNSPLWKRQRAERTLGNLEAEVDRALRGWLNKLLADKLNSTKIFKIMRAHRRGLLHLDKPQRWGHKDDFPEVAKAIRKLDKFSCVVCATTEVELHVHHIVYLSNFGTDQRTNLVTLCRSCHEKEHNRVFDFGEDLSATDENPLAPNGVNSDLYFKGMGLAAFYIETGTRCFTQYADRMVNNMGGDVKPYLLSFWEGLRSYPGLDTEGMTDPAESIRLFQEQA